MNEFTGWNQDQLVTAIAEGEARAKAFYEQRSEAEKAGRAVTKKVELMRKALTDLLLAPKQPKR